jgi:hypothetical protein
MIWKDPRAVRIPGGCIVWIGALDKDYYGKITLSKRNLRTHRVSYKQFYGIDPGKKLVCHKCDIPNCLNPRHLFLGTAKANWEDAGSKGRLWYQSKTSCVNGHKYTKDNTRINKYGYRRCRVCGRDQQKKMRRENPNRFIKYDRERYRRVRTSKKMADSL